MMRRIVVIGLLVTAVALAQGKKGGRGMDMPSIGFGPTSKLDRITEMLKLDKDQKKALKQNFDEAQKEAVPVHEQISKARVAIGEAVAAGKSQDEIAKAVNAEGALEVQMTMIELQAFTKVVQGLQEDQQAKASAVFPMMRGMFSGKNWNSD